MLLNLCASNQNTCFVVRCRVGGGVNSSGKLEKYSNNNVDTVFEILERKKLVDKHHIVLYRKENLVYYNCFFLV